MIRFLLFLAQLNRLRSISRPGSSASNDKGSAKSASFKGSFIKPEIPLRVKNANNSVEKKIDEDEENFSVFSAGSSASNKKHAAEALVGRCHPREASFPQKDRESRYYNPFVWCGVEIENESDRSNFAWDLERGKVLRRLATDESSIAVQINGTPCNEEKLIRARTLRQRHNRVVDFISRFDPQDGTLIHVKFDQKKFFLSS